MKRYELESVDYFELETLEDLQQVVDEITAVGETCFDLETTGLDTKTVEIVALGFSYSYGRAYGIICNHRGIRRWPEVREIVRPLFENPNIKKFGHNVLTFDAQVLFYQGITCKGLWNDTLIAHHALYSQYLPGGLDELSLHYFNFVKQHTDELPGIKLRGKRKSDWTGVEPEVLITYLCLNKEGRVYLEDGTTMKIGNIVDNRLPVKVLSMNPSTKVIEAKRVIDWHKIDLKPNAEDQRWLKVIPKYKESGRWGSLGTVFTPEHKMLTTNGWKQVQHLVPGEKVYIAEHKLSYKQTQLILGSLLGDASRQKRNTFKSGLKFGHCIKQLPYLNYKYELMKDICKVPVKEETRKPGKPGSTKFFSFFTKYTVQISELCDILYTKTGNKYITRNWLDKMGPMAWAVLYMDDGCLAGGKAARIYSLGLGLSGNRQLLKKLKSMGIDCTIQHNGAKSKFCFYIRLTNSSTKIFMQLIGAFIIPCMRYKLTSDAPEFNPILWTPDFSSEAATVEISSIIPYVPKYNAVKNAKYCITVEDNNNFFTLSGLAHNCEDCDFSFRLNERLEAELISANRLDYYNKIDRPMIQILFDLFTRGLCISKKQLNRLKKKAIAARDQAQQLLKDEHNVNINLNAAGQKAELLFNKLKLHTKYRIKPTFTKTGAFSTGAPVIKKFAKEPVVKLLLDYQKFQKLYSTYAKGMLQAIETFQSPVPILRATMSIATSTGRLNCARPNLQNIPRPDEDDPDSYLPRRAFVASASNRRILSADYSQLELRILAHCSKEPFMLEAFHQGLDLHSRTASEICHTKEPTKAQRAAAKSVNFGIAYGLREFRLSKEKGMSIKEAEAFIKRYFALMPRLHDYLEECKEFAHDHGYIENLFGRRRYFPYINSIEPKQRIGAENQATNHPIQSSAADLLYLAMIAINQELNKGTFDAIMRLQIHDEILFDVHETQVAAFKAYLEKTMTSVVSLDVPLEVSVGVGRSWAKAH